MNPPKEPEYATVNELNNVHRDVRGIRTEMSGVKTEMHKGFAAINKRLDERPKTALGRLVSRPAFTAILVALIGAVSVVGASFANIDKRVSNAEQAISQKSESDTVQCLKQNKLIEGRITGLRQQRDRILRDSDSSPGQKTHAQDYYDRMRSELPDPSNC